MRTDFYFDSVSGGKIHGCRWTPEGEPRAVVQIVHGIAEYVERYDLFANWLTRKGFLVVAEDHMGHGGSICEKTPKGCFKGGWMSVISDTYRLLTDTRNEFPDLPYILFGHSMGSFMTRTVLAKYPDSGIAGAVICGTGWMPKAVVTMGLEMSRLACALQGEDKPNQALYNLAFGAYNKKIEHPRTPSDWLTRDSKIVDAYEADPLCGFVPSAGMLRDMMSGILYIQRKGTLDAMRKDLPVLFIAGGDDPVGDYGSGVRKAVRQFKEHGMQNVSVKIYPLCRHEILNEINKEEVFSDATEWMETVISPN